MQAAPLRVALGTTWLAVDGGPHVSPRLQAPRARAYVLSDAQAPQHAERSPRTPRTSAWLVREHPLVLAGSILRGFSSPRFEPRGYTPRVSGRSSRNCTCLGSDQSYPPESHTYPRKSRRREDNSRPVPYTHTYDMTTSIRKWYRVELDSSGAILSCTEVEGAGRKNSHVRYVEALSAADATSEAKAWYEKVRQQLRDSLNRRRALREKAGKCKSCGKHPAKRHRKWCAECLGKCATRRAERVARGRPESPEEHAIKAKAHKDARRITYGTEAAARWFDLLRNYDANPSDFRAWLVGKITELGGAKALAEYESKRAEDLDKASWKAHKRACKTARAARSAA